MSFIKKLTGGADARIAADKERVAALHSAQIADGTLPDTAELEARAAMQRAMANGPGYTRAESVNEPDETWDAKALRTYSKHYDGMSTRRNEILTDIRRLEKELSEVELTMKATSSALNVLNEAKINEAASAAVEAELTIDPVIIHKHENINHAS